MSLAAFIALEVLIALVGVRVGQYWAEHRRRQRVTPAPPAASQMDPALKAQLSQAAAENYQKALEEAGHQFNQDLVNTSATVNGQIKQLATMVIGEELEHYREGLVQLRTQAVAALGDVQAAVQQQRQALEAGLAEEIKAEKERLLKQIDTKLGEAVSSFLLETMQHKIDIGAQSAYLMSMLEEHKAELKQEVMSEV